MKYQILTLPHADRQLDDLSEVLQERISRAIERLAIDPRPIHSKKLKNRTGWRIRVGSIRVIYDIDDAARRVLIMRIGHRREIYR